MTLRDVANLAEKIRTHKEQRACFYAAGEVVDVPHEGKRFERMLADFGVASLVGVYWSRGDFNALDLANDLRAAGVAL